MLKGKRSDAIAVLHGRPVVIFDCDDTILATARSRWAVLISTAERFGVTLTKEKIRAAWGLPFDQLIRTIVPGISFAQYVDAYRKAMRDTLPEITEGAVNLLTELKSMNVLMPIVTSSSKELTIQDLDALDLTHYFSDVYGQEQTKFHKPDPRVLDGVIRDLHDRGYAISDVVFVGDSVRDYRVAAGNDLDFIAVLSGLEERQDFIDAGLLPNCIAETLMALTSQ
jgi:phosphoglycolate phosphatase-like HAD superfamily hydrolase